MRFITEFKIEGKKWQGVLASHKTNSKFDLATLIEGSFSWQNPVNGNKDHYRLEIEAFPMDKWVEFKRELRDELLRCDLPHERIVDELISKLESFGNPVTTKNDQI
jgi:hypothetical protein